MDIFSSPVVPLPHYQVIPVFEAGGGGGGWSSLHRAKRAAVRNTFPPVVSGMLDTCNWCDGPVFYSYEGVFFRDGEGEGETQQGLVFNHFVFAENARGMTRNIKIPLVRCRACLPWLFTGTHNRRLHFVDDTPE